MFPGARRECPFSSMAMLELLRGMLPDSGLTAMGLSSFRHWAWEAANHPREIREAALPQTISSTVEAAYRRGDVLVLRLTGLISVSGDLSGPASEHVGDSRDLRPADRHAYPQRLSIPGERAAVLIFDHARFEEVLLLLQVHRLTHPGKWVLDRREHGRQPELGAAAVGDEMHVLLAQRRVQAEEAAGHGIAAIGSFKLGGVAQHAAHFVLERLGPQMRVLVSDLVDHVDAEVQMDALVAQDVLVLLGDADHLVAPAKR